MNKKLLQRIFNRASRRLVKQGQMMKTLQLLSLVP
jgi:hypothetical protein